MSSVTIAIFFFFRFLKSMGASLDRQSLWQLCEGLVRGQQSRLLGVLQQLTWCRRYSTNPGSPAGIRIFVVKMRIALQCVRSYKRGFSKASYRIFTPNSDDASEWERGDFLQ